MKSFSLFLLYNTSVSFKNLPHDMQVLIEQILDANGQPWDLMENTNFKIEKISLNRFPDLPLDDPDRNEEYSMRIPRFPILIADDQWLDGHHRVWAAKQRNEKFISAINLAKYGLKLTNGYSLLGKIKV